MRSHPKKIRVGQCGWRVPRRLKCGWRVPRRLKCGWRAPRRLKCSCHVPRRLKCGWRVPRRLKCRWRVPRRLSPICLPCPTPLDPPRPSCCPTPLNPNGTPPPHSANSCDTGNASENAVHKSVVGRVKSGRYDPLWLGLFTTALSRSMVLLNRLPVGFSVGFSPSFVRNRPYPMHEA